MLIYTRIDWGARHMCFIRNHANYISKGIDIFSSIERQPERAEEQQ